MKYSSLIIEKCNRNQLDQDIKIEECFLTVHNFINFNSNVLSRNNKSFDNILKNDQNFKTYVYSYTKPFLIELVQNATKNCLCCE